jgi:hypothetical protein
VLHFHLHSIKSICVYAPFFTLLEIEPRAFYMLGKHSATGALSWGAEGVLTILPRLAWDSYAQVTLLPQPPK